MEKQSAFWLPEQIDTLSNLWSTHSAAVIADMIGKSRNAVIGKANRLTLPMKRNPTIVKQRAIRPRRERPPPPRPRVIEVPRPVNLHIMELEPHHCRAVIGHGPEGLARYCGATTEARPVLRRGEPVVDRNNQPIYERKSYCAPHAALYYYQPPQ